jgi:hypothetical protein
MRPTCTRQLTLGTAGVGKGGGRPPTGRTRPPHNARLRTCSGSRKRAPHGASLPRRGMATAGLFQHRRWHAGHSMTGGPCGSRDRMFSGLAGAQHSTPNNHRTRPPARTRHARGLRCGLLRRLQASPAPQSARRGGIPARGVQLPAQLLQLHAAPARGRATGVSWVGGACCVHLFVAH